MGDSESGKRKSAKYKYVCYIIKPGVLHKIFGEQIKVGSEWRSNVQDNRNEEYVAHDTIML